MFIFLSDVFSSGIWSSLSICRDPSLQGLAYKLPSTVLASKAPGAIDSYRRAFARWKEFAAAKEEIDAFPAKTEHVAYSPLGLMFLRFSSSVGPFVLLLSLFLALSFFVFTVSDFCLKKINAYGNSFVSNSYIVLYFFLHFSQVSKFNLLLLLV